MKKLFKLFSKPIIGMIISVGILLGCQNQDEAITPEIENFAPEGNKMVLGVQLENPYSVENIRKALANLKANGRTAGDFNIETTDLYIRFLPRDSTEMYALEADTVLALFDHPWGIAVQKQPKYTRTFVRTNLLKYKAL